MSVSLLIGQLGLGGTEKQVVLLAQELRARGARVTVLLMFGGGPREADLAGVRVVRLGFGRINEPRSAPRNAAAALRLVRVLRRDRPDVLHAFLIASYLVAAPAAKLARVPLVAGRRSLGDFKEGKRLVLAVERIANRMTAHVIANARAVADDAIRQEGLDPAKVSVVRNGLPAEAFDVTSRPSAAPTVLCVANLKAYKGHEHLLEALRLLAARGVKCRAVLVGDGAERAGLERRARGLDVRFEGFRKDTTDLLAEADVFVLPSLEEGMSNAVMEAMAAGKPIVATAVGGTPELLGADRGLLVPPSDAHALADGLARLLTDRVLAERLGAAAREWSRANLSVEAMVDEHVRIYRRVLACAR
jgi:glycosyltransferase involved in cell wall biosynthesis